MADVVEEGPEEDEGARAGARAADEDLVAAVEVWRVVEVALGEDRAAEQGVEGEERDEAPEAVYPRTPQTMPLLKR